MASPAIEEAFEDIHLNCSDLAVLRFTDKIQIGHQLVAASIGLPINVVTLVKIVLALRVRYRRVLCLNLLLNISNILVLLLCIWYTIWLLDFWWKSGQTFCKIFAFLHTFVFYLYSNATVSIALEMLMAVCFPFFNYQHSRCLALSLILVSTLLAAATSAPQLFFWDLDTVSCSDLNKQVSQCSYMLHDKAWYNIFHNLVVFWAPLATIIPAYIVVSMSIWRHYRTADKLQKPRNSNCVPPEGRKPSKFSIAAIGRCGKSCETNSRASSVLPSEEVIEDAMARNNSLISDVSECDEFVRRIHQHQAKSTTHQLWRSFKERFWKTKPKSADGDQRLSIDCSTKLVSVSGSPIEIRHSHPISNDISLGATKDPNGNKTPLSPVSSPQPPPTVLERRKSDVVLRRTFHSTGKMRSKRMKFLKSSFAIVSVYIVSWMPYQVCSIWNLTHPETAEDDNVKIYLECLEAVMYIGTVINPFLYRFAMTKQPTRQGSKTA